MEHHQHEHAPATNESMSATDPVCGMTVEPSKAKGHVEHDGTTYHFCSQGCLEKFRKDPQAYLERRETATDPVCGMSVEPSKAKATREHGGSTYYFCCNGCAAKFEADPEAYLSGRKGPKAGPQMVRIGSKPAPQMVQIGSKPAPRRRRGRRWSTSARWTRRCWRTGRATARSAAWRWSRRRSPCRGRRAGRFATPARCTRRSCRTSRAIARSAAWRWSRWSRPRRRRPIPSCAT